MDIPCETYSPSIGKLSVGTEHRGTIESHIDIEKVTVVIGISSIEIEVCATAFAVVIRRLAVLSILV